ncbi:hypothetical protein FHT85_002047 [Rhizobium sp. BK312]|jgi:hypothetical protein|uniref:Uncharacterized protein n=1 Tax=Rhizobium miluonense TaxID=411945 RepID=A0ABU1SJS2_9HYPH|nr:hypothetical protein [Rhizobium sp. BK312]MDR6899230.1 hypothetical protein [Rhizobium miluonense]
MNHPPDPGIDPKRVPYAADQLGTNASILSDQIPVGTFESSGVINAR